MAFCKIHPKITLQGGVCPVCDSPDPKSTPATTSDPDITIPTADEVKDPPDMGDSD